MKKSTACLLTAFAVGFFYRFLTSLQGIDQTDLGFCMTFYQNIFHRPDVMPSYFLFYLTGLCGGLWNEAFGTFGLIGFRLFEALTLTMAILLVYLTFRRWLTTTTWKVVAILLSFLFPSFAITFHYDTLTFFLVAASLYTFSATAPFREDHCLTSTQWLMLFLSGVLIGICFFARIVNATLGALILIPFLAAWYCCGIKSGVKRALVYGVGMISGTLLIVAVMFNLGHWPYFEESIQLAFSTFSGSIDAEAIEETAESTQPTHASTNLFAVYFKSYVNIFLQMIILAAVALVYAKCEKHLKHHTATAAKLLVFTVLLILVATSNPYLSAIAGATLSIGIYLIRYRSQFKDDISLPVLCCYSLASIYLFAFGSDIGIPGIFHWCGALLIVPSMVCLERFSQSWTRRYAACFWLCVALCMLWRMGYRAYGEQEPRTSCGTKALSGTLNVLTTAERAARYQKEVALIRQYYKGEYLFLAHQHSEMYYATGLLPFLGTTQLGVLHGKTLLGALDYQRMRFGARPVIVFPHYERDVDGVEKEQVTLSRWMETNNYVTAYSDDSITIYTPR